MTTPDISDLVLEILNQLRLHPNDVEHLTIYPAKGVTATLFLTNDNGSKYVTEHGHPAITNVHLDAITRKPTEFFLATP